MNRVHFHHGVLRSVLLTNYMKHLQIDTLNMFDQKNETESANKLGHQKVTMTYFSVLRKCDQIQLHATLKLYLVFDVLWTTFL